MMTFEELNNLGEPETYSLFEQCCASTGWINLMVSARPFVSLTKLLEKSREIWSSMDETEFLMAFEAHPKIGDVNSLKKKYANTAGTAASEQKEVEHTTDAVIEKLSSLNEEYFTKFGFIFIVFATGKSAEQMLGLLIERLPNNRDKEIELAAIEQEKITQLRLSKIIVPKLIEED